MKIQQSLLCRLVRLLNDGHYHDSEQLSQSPSTTSTDIASMIQALQSYDIKIDFIKNKGYALLEPLILLDKAYIQKNILIPNVDLTVFESIDSTNHALSTGTLPNTIHLCLAEQQTQGRGRLQRTWHSPFGQNIYLSCAYPIQKEVGELAGLSLIISLAIVKALDVYRLANPIQVKWPNDILYLQQKLCGILIEVQANHAIIGIGINANMMHDPQVHIDQAWTSLRQMTGTYIDRNELCVFVINQLLAYLEKFQQQGLVAFLAEWQAVDCLFKKEMMLKNGEHIIRGKGMGIDHQGHLILELSDGLRRSFSSGDTSIIKG